MNTTYNKFERMLTPRLRNYEFHLQLLFDMDRVKRVVDQLLAHIENPDMDDLSAAEVQQVVNLTQSLYDTHEDMEEITGTSGPISEPTPFPRAEPQLDTPFRRNSQFALASNDIPSNRATGSVQQSVPVANDRLPPVTHLIQPKLSTEKPKSILSSQTTANGKDVEPTRTVDEPSEHRTDIIQEGQPATDKELFGIVSSGETEPDMQPHIFELKKRDGCTLCDYHQSRWDSIRDRHWAKAHPGHVWDFKTSWETRMVRVRVPVTTKRKKGKSATHSADEAEAKRRRPTNHNVSYSITEHSHTIGGTSDKYDVNRSYGPYATLEHANEASAPFLDEKYELARVPSAVNYEFKIQKDGGYFNWKWYTERTEGHITVRRDGGNRFTGMFNTERRTMYVAQEVTFDPECEDPADKHTTISHGRYAFLRDANHACQRAYKTFLATRPSTIPADNDVDTMDEASLLEQGGFFYRKLYLDADEDADDMDVDPVVVEWGGHRKRKEFLVEEKGPGGLSG